MSGDRVHHGGEACGSQGGWLPVALECEVPAPHIMADREAGRTASEAEKMEQGRRHGYHSKTKRQWEGQRGFPSVV